jgi:hypothetical protein
LAPSFLKVIGFIGAFMFLCLGVVLPGLMYYWHFKEQKTVVWKMAMWVWILVNSALWIVATVYSIQAEV